MALIRCPECGKEISDKAVSCPNCGCPMRQEPVEYLREEYEEDEEEEKESGVSIATLVCYILSVIFNILSVKLLGGLLALVTLILLTISYCKKGKCTCANIVFWINVVCIVLLVIGVVISALLN